MDNIIEQEKTVENQDELIGNHRDSAAKLRWRLDEATRIGRTLADL